MKKVLLSAILLSMCYISIAQDDLWSRQTVDSALPKDKSADRPTFPKHFILFKLNLATIRQRLMSIVDKPTSSGIIIFMPNIRGGLEKYEISESSNFDEQLQKQFPDIRAFTGKGLTDSGATLKLSLSPQGIDATIFRATAENEYIALYSADHLIYAVYKSDSDRRMLPWKCTTPDQKMENSLDDQIKKEGTTARGGYNLKTLRLAQSVTAEYSNYFGATSAAQVGLVLTAVNNTLNRCNGVYEKDLALHLNLVGTSTNAFYYNTATDPYDPASTGIGGNSDNGTWHAQLQNTLDNVIGSGNYDIGHLFSAVLGGGNAGCIGCICSNGSKGRGFTAYPYPQGDNFDIDYVVHEVGHQLGANHTFSYSDETTGVQDEVGSGITIMGYAGVTDYDVAAHSIAIYHAASIAQIQGVLNSKTCPVTTTFSSSNLTINPVSNYTIPISTPFKLTAAATSGVAGDILTYCWEEMDNGGSSHTGSNSIAIPAKGSGPNWISLLPTASGTRLFPNLTTILTGGTTTGPQAGGDAGINTEALSSVSRTLNFRVTVRDNAQYHSTAPVRVGQTQYANSVVTVTGSSGPFVVTAPNTAITWDPAVTQNVTWNVANTTASPVSCAYVNILLSTDGGQTFPTVLASNTPNDGSQYITLPNISSTTARIKVESVGNIFFDISNTNFTIASCNDQAPQLTGTFSTACCTNTLYTMNSVPVGNVFVQYQWPNVINVTATPTTGSPTNVGFTSYPNKFSFNIASGQQVSVIISGTYYCGSVSATRTFVQYPSFRIAASPNPARDNINVKLINPIYNKQPSSLATNNQTHISLYDSRTGRLVQQWSFSEVKATDYNLKLFSTRTGTYDLKVERNGQSAVTKIIVGQE